MKNRSKLKNVVVGLALLTMIAGCSSDAGPETHPVTGIVTYQGSPVIGASLAFFADGEGANGQAITDDAGKFDAFTSLDMGKSDKAGMTAGKYRVTVIKLDTESIKLTMQPPKDLLPKKYGSAERSGLTATITPGKDNHFEFELK